MILCVDLNRTVVDTDWRFDNLCGSHLWLTFTLKMTTAQVVETSVSVNNCPFLDYVRPDDHDPPTYEMTPGFKPCNVNVPCKRELTIKPFVIGTRMLKTKMRAFSFIVHFIGELGGHKTLPTLKNKNHKKMKLRFAIVKPKNESKSFIN